MKIDQIEKAFEKHIDVATLIIVRPDLKIFDMNKFVSSHISYLRANSGNVLYMPYYDRLLETLEHLEKTSSETSDQSNIQAGVQSV